MDKYKKLTQNTFIFFLGESGTKLAAFLMLRYYTGVLTTSEFGIIDLIITTTTFLVPVITLGINQGVFRFSMDTGTDRSNVLFIGLVIVTAGNLFLLLIISALHFDFILWDYILLVWLVSFASATKAIIVSYCRGIGRSKLYAAAGVIQSIFQIGAAVLFISVLHLQIEGYIYAVTLANVLTSVIVSIGIRKEFRFKWHIDKELTKQMLVYSIPLIVHLIGWLLMSSIDKYVILAQISTSANGLFSAASKLPMLITTISAIFMRAWQLSSVDESKSLDKDEFHTKIFHLLHITLVLVAMVLLIFIRPIYDLMVGDAFEGCWQYTPFLMLAAVFSCFASFMSTNYIAMKETTGAVFTMTAAAAINLGLNVLLTKYFGINGTAFATMVSYIVLWILITFNTAKFAKIRIQYTKFILTYLLLLAQAFIIVSGHSLYYVQVALLAIVVVMNYRDIRTIYNRVMNQLRSMRS